MTTLAVAQLPLPAVPVYAHYHAANSSLPAELIYKVHADRNGYLWLATDRGLIRYNGREFTTVPMKTQEDYISTCMTADNKLLLFAYSGHTAGIDLGTQKIINTDSLYGLSRQQPLGRFFLRGFQEGNMLSLYSQGMVRVVKVQLDTWKSRVLPLNPSEAARELLRQYRFAPGWQQQLMPELVYMLTRNNYGLSEKDGFVTIGNRIFSVAPGREARLYFDGNAYGIHTYIMGFARRENDLYLGGLHEIGLCRIKEYFSAPPAQHVVEALLPGEAVTCVERDYLGNIWAGTHGNGLFLFPYSERNTLYYNKSGSGLYSDEVSFIGRFPGGITALGYNDAVADFYPAAGGKRQRSRLPADNDMRGVRHMERMSSGWLAFTANETFFARSGSGIFPGVFRHALLKERSIDPGYKGGGQYNGTLYYASGNTIVAIDSNGIISRDPSANFTLAKKNCLLPLADTEFYIGTIRGGYRNATALPYLRNEQINAIDTVEGQLCWATNTGVYVVPLKEAGTGRMLRKVIGDPCSDIKHDPSFTYLRCQDDLVIVENRTLKQVARFSSRNYVIPFRLGSFSIEGDYLALAGNRGVFYIPRSNLLKQCPGHVPRMYVLCSLNGKAPADSLFSCSFRDDLVALFELDILDYKKEQRAISCRIFRDGKELYRQTELDAGGAVTLHPPAPGRYRIEYHIGSAGCATNRVLAYTLIVAPLWYQQWWFLPLLLLLAGAGGSYILYSLYVRKIKNDRYRLQQKLYLQELEAQSLLGQLKPHFIFNILTPLQGFFMRGEKVRGLDYLDSFSRLMRGLLNGIRDRYAPLSAELSFIEHYLQVQQERFDHCFAYTISLDPSLDAGRCIIPTLLLQPLVENAVEHGIDKMARDGGIVITVEDRGACIAIRIRDNGKGLPPGFRLRQNHALMIIAERVQLLRKINGTGHFSIYNNEEGAPGVTSLLIITKTNQL